MGAVIAFILGACIPIAILGFTVLERGEIAAYQIERVKGFGMYSLHGAASDWNVVCVNLFFAHTAYQKNNQKKGK